MYEIEKGIPVPKRIERGGRSPLYPFKEMGIGDSIFIPGDRSKHPTNWHGYYAKRTGFKFVIRKVEGGFRVWRVE